MKGYVLFAFALFGLSQCMQHHEISLPQAVSSNYMDCYMGEYESSGYCYCDSLWGGIDCNLCEGSGSGCSYCYTTIDSVFSAGFSGFSCSKASQGIYTDATWGAGFSLDFNVNGGYGTGVVNAYEYYNGQPFLYNCSLQSCYSSTSSGGVSAVCYDTSCAISTALQYPATYYIPNAYSTTTFKCDYSGNCTLQIGGVPENINFMCQASYCEGMSPTPTPTPTPGPNSCFDYDDCTSCGNSGCYWCLDTSSCSSTPGSCEDVVKNPQYCPGPDCSSYSDCEDCTYASCTWCLDSDVCFDLSKTSTSCSDYVSQSQYCSL
eukprot:TRINITY_DN45_c0_g1_i5.p1 TRINITY_DN45_c0_g1~~TRINITY_DN45_c0_g1_i5.p1  ORF type:complete len:333 (-),score=15.69 TRINITY_DN45_c0_g1_i5:44-997(-)